MIGKLLGVAESELPVKLAAGAMERHPGGGLAFGWAGLPRSRQVVEEPEPGKAFGVLMFEHTWAIPLRDAIRRAGGVPLAQGFLTPEALVMVGEELQAIAEAERTIEVAQIVQSCRHPGYTGHPRKKLRPSRLPLPRMWYGHWPSPNLIEEAAVAEAIETLAAADLLEAKYLEAATKADAQEAAEDKEYFSAVE